MARRDAHFDWRKSPAHIHEIKRFWSGMDFAAITSPSWMEYKLGESERDAAQRLINEGMLVPCNLEETLYATFSASDLKRLAKEEGLRTSGTKKELIERLLSADRPRMESLTRNLQVMKPSREALDFLEKYNTALNEASEAAKRTAFELFLVGDYKEAYRVFLAYEREWSDPDYGSSSYYLDQLESILTSMPNILDGIRPSDIEVLRAVTCMRVLWIRERVDDWLPDNFESPVKSGQVACNYLACNARINRELNLDPFGKRVKVVFRRDDVDSCARCLALKDRIFLCKEFPDVPLPGCTSYTGCRMRLQPLFEEVEVVLAGIENGDVYAEDDPFAVLSRLKKMLDNGLITDEEYQGKKEEILSRM